MQLFEIVEMRGLGTDSNIHQRNNPRSKNQILGIPKNKILQRNVAKTLYFNHAIQHSKKSLNFSKASLRMLISFFSSAVISANVRVCPSGTKIVSQPNPSFPRGETIVPR